MSDTKVLTPEQIAGLRAAIAAHPDHANVPSEECPRCAWQSKLGDVAISLLDAAERCGERDDIARRLGEATAALLALRKWVDEYSDLVERSKRWVHDSTMWETSSYPELAEEWQALWNRYPESVIDINTTPPADGSGEGA